MAMSLSQYIGAIRQQRNADLAQKLQGLTPLLEADLARRTKAEETAQKIQQRGNDYYNTILGTHGEERANSFRAGSEGIQTPEGMDFYYNNLSKEWEGERTSDDYLNILKQVGLPEEELTKAKTAFASVNTPEARKALLMEYSSRAPKNIQQVDIIAQTTLDSEGYAQYQSLSKTKPPTIALTEAADAYDYRKKDALLTLGDSHEKGSGGGGWTPGRINDAKWGAVGYQYQAYVDQKDPIVYMKAKSGADKGTIYYSTVYLDDSGALKHSVDGKTVQLTKSSVYDYIPKANVAAAIKDKVILPYTPNDQTTKATPQPLPGILEGITDPGKIPGVRKISGK
jgi:hypothetical protein